MEEELERWKIEVRELRQERVATDGWRKQISDLERDLETALDSLQSAEAKVIELRSEQQSAAAGKKDHEDAQEKLAAYEATVEQLKVDLELVRAEKEKTLEEAATNQKEQLVQLESRNQGNFTQLTMVAFYWLNKWLLIDKYVNSFAIRTRTKTDSGSTGD